MAMGVFHSNCRQLYTYE